MNATNECQLAVLITEVEPEALVKRMFKLAYDACGGPAGMGIFQARNDADEDDVFKNVCANGDYPFLSTLTESEQKAKEGRFNADYVFGRMMKWDCKFNGKEVVLRDGFRSDYQGFSGRYPNAKALLEAGLASLGVRPDSYEVI